MHYHYVPCQSILRVSTIILIIFCIIQASKDIKNSLSCLNSIKTFASNVQSYFLDFKHHPVLWRQGLVLSS